MPSKKASPPPKKGLSSFFLYLDEHRADLRKKNPKKKITEITTIASKQFKELSQNERKKYDDLAVKDKQRYEKELEAYNAKYRPSMTTRRKNKENNAEKNETKRTKITTRSKSKSEEESRSSIILSDLAIRNSNSKKLVENNPTNSIPEKRVWSIFYDNTEQKITVFPETRLSEILESICTIYNFSRDQQLLFLDDNGIPIVLSSSIPTGTKIFMQKKQTLTETIIAQMSQNLPSNTPEFYWLEPSNSSHKRKNNNLTVYQPYHENMSHCFGSIIITSGKYYFTLLFEPLICCVFGGIEDSNKRNQERINSEFINEIKLYQLLGLDRHEGPLSSFPAYEVGFLVDMEKKILTVTNHRAKKLLTKQVFTWNQVSPFVFFKYVVSITITSAGSFIPSWV